MPNHHTKDKGDLGVFKAQLDLYTKGFEILIPQTEHAPFDLGIYKDGTIKTVQVKYRSLDSTGALQVRFENMWADRHGTHCKPVDKTSIDMYCVYCPETDLCYYFDPKKFNKNVTLRISEPKNNQKSNVNLSNDYLEVPWD